MDNEQKAIERIRIASEMSLQYYGLPLVCTYSGGKDSDVVLELFKRSGVPFEVHHSHTTADAPETVRHVRKVFHDLELQGTKCGIDYHERPDGTHLTMWNLIPKKLMPPTRIVRYCCSALKETGCSNRMIATGIRWGESNNRKSRGAFEVLGKNKNSGIHIPDEKMLLTDNGDTRRLFESCQVKAKTVVNPIIDWKDDDVWSFYGSEVKVHNPVYGLGFDRCGCVGCPMAGRQDRKREFAAWPEYKLLYTRAFCKMLETRKERGKKTQWCSGEEIFHWWMEDDNVFGQMSFEDFPEWLPE